MMVFPGYLCWKCDDGYLHSILEGSPDSQHHRQQVQPPVLWMEIRNVHGRVFLT